MPERASELTPQGIKAHGQVRPLISGDVHYWRHHPQDWPGVLDRIAGLGLKVVCTYIPWSVHELRRGEFDFGKLDPRRDLSRFLDLVHERGMWALARPGPHINAELTWFGYPRRILDDPEIRAWTSADKPAVLPIPPRAFYIPSYASEKLYEELALYFDALAPLLRRHMAPQGPIVAIQSDNECSFCFRTAPFDLDYHPDARAAWERFIAERGQAGTAMPRRYEPQNERDLTLYLDWVTFKEELIAGSLDRIQKMWRERGVRGLVTFHNFPPSTAAPPLNIPRVEQTHDAAGIDSYLQRGQYALLRRRMLTLCGQSRFPFVPEFSSGCYLAWPPITLEDQRFTTLAALALGVKGINFYMIADRERWYGAPITNNGRIRVEHYEFFKQLNSVIERSGVLRLQPVVQWGLALSRDYNRLTHAANLLSPIPTLISEGLLDAESMCDERSAGLSHPVAIEAACQLDSWYEHLRATGVAAHVTEPEIEPERLARYKVLVAPSFEFLCARAQTNLRAFAESGGTLVLGPLIPDRDERMADCSILGELMRRPSSLLLNEPDVPLFEAGKGRIVLLPALLPKLKSEPFPRVLDLIAAIERLAGTQRPFAPSDNRIDVWLHRPPGVEHRGVLFLVNPTERRRVTALAAPDSGTTLLIDYFSNETLGGRGDLTVAIDAYSVRMFEVTA